MVNCFSSKSVVAIYYTTFAQKSQCTFSLRRQIFCRFLFFSLSFPSSCPVWNANPGFALDEPDLNLSDTPLAVSPLFSNTEWAHFPQPHHKKLPALQVQAVLFSSILRRFLNVSAAAVLDPVRHGIRRHGRCGVWFRHTLCGGVRPCGRG